MASTITRPNPVTAAQTIESIRQAAIVKWGADRWLTDLTRHWCELYADGGDTTANYRNKRSQLGRIFDTGNPTLETLVQLAACVGLSIEVK